MYFISSTSTLIFSILIGAIALSLSNRNYFGQIAILCCCIASTFLWTAYPPEVSTPLATPSTNGLRFLPATALATHLVINQTVGLLHSHTGLGHALWAIGLFWPPESDFYCTFIWWPFYLWTKRDQKNCKFIYSIFKSSLTLLILTMTLIAAFTASYHLISNEFPSISDYIAYAANPPGLMQANPHGAILFLISTLLLGSYAVFRSLRSSPANFKQQKAGIAIQLLCYSVASYYLGRSHNNNILNLMPFTLLLLLYATDVLSVGTLHVASVTMISAVLGWLPTFGWDQWRQTWDNNKLVSFNSQNLSHRMTLTNQKSADTVSNLFKRNEIDSGSPHDAGQAIQWIRKHRNEPVTVIEYTNNLSADASTSAWSAIHGPANFSLIPSELRKIFIKIASEKVNKSGWLKDYDGIYHITEKKDFFRIMVSD